MQAALHAVLLANSEVAPLVKTGGLADVSASLPAALAAIGADVRVLLPGYPAILSGMCESRTEGRIGPSAGLPGATLLSGRINDRLRCLVVDCPELYGRAGNPYVDGAGADWTDNPLRFGLLMERFLNPERVSMPDIDVDFCQDRREEVIAHTREKYGQDLVSQIITYGKLQAKAALKDVARTLGVDFKASDRITKLVPAELGIKLEKAYEEERLARWLKESPVVARVGRLALRVEGMTRQTGVHAAGRLRLVVRQGC